MTADRLDHHQAVTAAASGAAANVPGAAPGAARSMRGNPSARLPRAAIERSPGGPTPVPRWRLALTAAAGLAGAAVSLAHATGVRP